MSLEEQKAAVLAECERLCPKQGEIEFYPLLLLEKRIDRHSILRLTKPRTQAIGICAIYLDSDADDIQFEIAYRLLGLNTPPADPKWEKLKAELKIRNEMIVAEIKSGPQYGLPKSAMDTAYATGHALGWIEGTMERIEKEESL